MQLKWLTVICGVQFFCTTQIPVLLVNYLFNWNCIYAWKHSWTNQEKNSVTHPECSKNVFTGFPVSPSKVFTAPSAMQTLVQYKLWLWLGNNCHTETLWWSALLRNFLIHKKLPNMQTVFIHFIFNFLLISYFYLE